MRIAAFGAVVYLLYVFAAETRGLIGPDEPRYAAVAREMASSGDWITPRLWDEAWYEKPPLLYWAGAAFDALGVPSDLATRLPVALLSAIFLALFWRELARLRGRRAADIATVCLATSAGYAAFSQAGVFDAPLTAILGAALLCLAPWIEEESRQERLPWFGALLGLSLLTKGLVGLPIAALALLPTVFERGPLRVARDLFRPRVLLPFVLVGAPWYAASLLINPGAFFEEFLWRHHVQRLFSDDLQHVQPVWFYLPVLIGALLPWTPLLAAPPVREIRSGRFERFLLAWAAGVVFFFSLSKNKLPGYILPALPAIAALVGIRLSRPPVPRLALTVSALSLALVPVAAAILPEALADGLRDAWPPERIEPAPLVLVIAAAFGVAALAGRAKPRPAALVLGVTAVLALAHLKVSVYPALDRAAGTRTLWREIEGQAKSVCLGELRRHVLYGLAFYSGNQLPECKAQPRPLVLTGEPPRLLLRNKYNGKP